MDMNDSRRIAAEPALVWQALLDSDVLKEAVPGCEELSGSADEGYEAVVLQKVGPVKARFKGNVTLSERVEGESLVLTGEGKGGAAGFAKGVAHVRLEPDGDATILHYKVEAKVGGKLAQLGSRLIDGFARKMADEFFNRFQQAIEVPEETAENEAGANENQGEGAARKGWFRRMLRRD